MKRPAAYNNNWLGNTVTTARLRVIDETDIDHLVWKTVGECIDTPNAIEAELKKEQYKGLSIWKFDQFGGKWYLRLVK